MTAPSGQPELPPDLERAHRRAVRLEWLTIAYLVTAVVVVYLTLGSSQAMKAAWIEDLLSFLPPIAFLVASRLRHKDADTEHPFGYHRAVGVAYLVAAVALLVMGAYLIYDSGLKLLLAEHPPIGLVELFGREIWLGWLMLAALAYTGVPPVVLGRLKAEPARVLHDKVLYADAEMNKADWMTAGGAALGVVGIGVGLWWADAVAAICIGISILRDGLRNVRAALLDLMDARASRYDDKDAPHPLIRESHDLLLGLDWVEVAQVRVREEGHVFHVEAFVVPRSAGVTLAQVDDARERLHDLDWKLYDVVVAPVTELPIGNVEEPQRPG